MREVLNKFVVRKDLLRSWLDSDLDFLSREKTEEEMNKLIKKANKLVASSLNIESDIIGLLYHKDTDFYSIDMSIVDKWKDNPGTAVDFLELEDFT